MTTTLADIIGIANRSAPPHQDNEAWFFTLAAENWRIQVEDGNTRGRPGQFRFHCEKGDVSYQLSGETEVCQWVRLLEGETYHDAVNREASNVNQCLSWRAWSLACAEQNPFLPTSPVTLFQKLQTGSFGTANITAGVDANRAQITLVSGEVWEIRACDVTRTSARMEGSFSFCYELSKNGVAIGHSGVSTFEEITGVIDLAEELQYVAADLIDRLSVKDVIRDQLAAFPFKESG